MFVNIFRALISVLYKVIDIRDTVFRDKIFDFMPKIRINQKKFANHA